MTVSPRTPPDVSASPRREEQPQECGTIVVESARLELLQCLAWLEADTERIQAEENAGVIDIYTGRAQIPGCWPTHVPLFVADWKCEEADIELAARECKRLGEIELLYGGRHPNGPMVRITKVGLEWIHARMPNLAGEIAIAGAERALRMAELLSKNSPKGGR